MKIKLKKELMKLIEFIKSIFRKKRKRINIYSDAISEGMKEALEELGYSRGKDDKIKL